MKRIGILTSGGDCAGLNAAMRSIFYRAKKYGMEVVGIKDGTLGLIQRPVNSIELNYEIVSGSLFREGGTFLGTTNKGDPFHFKGEDGKYSDSVAIICDSDGKNKMLAFDIKELPKLDKGRGVILVKVHSFPTRRSSDYQKSVV